MSVHHEGGDARQAGQSRRGFLRNAALAGAGAAALGATAATPAFADDAERSSAQKGKWNPDTTSRQFTLAVMPDTQFLYWGSQHSVNREPQEESFRYIIGNDIVFMSHLGDLTEDADPSSFQEVGKAFELLDAQGVGYSVLAGNHDVSGDDSRGSTSYLQTMGPQRFKRAKTFAGSDPSGYNTAHIFRAAGQDWLVLALDWRTTDQGFAWADNFIKAHPKLPVILTTHEIVAPNYGDNVFPYVYGDPENNASLSSYGQTVWNKLINDNDQIFLTLNGHYWPAARMTRQNAAGNDVHLHLTNYQNRYYGGAAMLRLYHFDLDRNIIDVETVAPWILAQDPDKRNVLAAQQARLTTATDDFSVPIDFEQRFARFIPVPQRASRPAGKLLVPGTLAYWRFDGGGAPGTPVTADQTIRDLSGHGNDLTLESVGAAVLGSLRDQVSAVTASAENAPNEVAVNLKDGNPSSKWLVFDTTGSVTYRMAKPVVARSYSLTSANDEPGRDPKDFTLQGSADGNAWTDLDAQTGQSFSARLATNTYTFTNTTAYAYYRLAITANSGDALLQLGEWDLGDGANHALVWSADHHPDQPAHASLTFAGGKNPLHGAYLTTAAKAALNAETFGRGFTIEAFVKFPLDWSSSNNAWSAVLSRWGEAGKAGKSGANTDLQEPVASLSFSDGREPQFNVYPLNQKSPTTNWGHSLPEDTWWHVAVVNDGRHTTLYVEGAETIDNPDTVSNGIATLGLQWMLGGYEYGGKIDQIFHGSVGDVRIVNRALPVDQFMIGK
ncbi:LamG-like jellyroll fold domain-containing protein [Actinoplanes sp. TBRC 11911]|uniref:LamG-like jellyroll fold domain-containing protein n=1 Tax=Actinoplanes sp. TBRC 11911 TaxID=2729386 RepID=UPI0020071A4A|nr:LamG-like jellyroll fold domain-containing protein [Actinoplanes sp. TBRC 11911]